MGDKREKIKITHLTIARNLSSGQIKQISYENESRKRLNGAIWSTFAFHDGEEYGSYIKKIPILFKFIFIRNLYGWIKAINLSKECDFLLMRHMTFDPFALIFSPFIKNRISIHHSKETLELKLVAPGWRGRAAAILETLTGRVAARNALALLGVTEEIAEYECSTYGVKKPIFVYPNGIVPADISLLEDERRAGEINAAFICGHFSSWHGLDKLVEAAIVDRSNAAKTPVIFHLIGVVSREQVQEIAKINNPMAMFICHGPLAEEHYRKILNQCDIGIASLALERKGLTEASSLKVREMLAMGLPIVSSHRDAVMSDDATDYIILDKITLQQLRDIAVAKKSEIRSTVRQRNIDKISKLQSMQRVVEFCRHLPPNKSSLAPGNQGQNRNTAGMKPLSIVIVTYNWPPRNAIGTHRPYAWAKRWSERGASVTVLTARKQPYDAPLDLNLPQLASVHVEEIAYGTTVAKLGGGVLRGGVARRIAKTAISWVRNRFGVNADIREKWRMAAQERARQLAERADIVISTYGPAASHLIAFDMKQHNPALHWVADYRDLWSQRHTVELTARHRARERQLEISTVAEKADLLAAVSQDMVEKLGELTGKPVLLVRNGFDLGEEALRKQLKRRTRPSSAPFRLVHTGTLYDGLRDPEPLLAALVELHNAGRMAEGAVTVDFYGTRVDAARRLADRPEYAPFIRLMGHVPRAEALKAQHDADLLLLLESPDPRARGVLTGKVFEYIASGTPVLSLGSLADYEIPKLLDETGTGTSFGYDETGDLKEFLVHCLDDVRQATAYRPNLSRILRYSRHRQADEFYKELEQRFGLHG